MQPNTHTHTQTHKPKHITSYAKKYSSEHALKWSGPTCKVKTMLAR